MQLEQIRVPLNNKILEHYYEENEHMTPFFPYALNDDAFAARHRYLQTQPRTAGLAEAIAAYMAPFGMTEAVQRNIDALANGAVAVVGGQQAGVFTGPLYSVYKAITVLTVAQQQSDKLGVDVVPVFWIAGEDHDIDEINHTFTNVNNVVKKRGYSERSRRKTMASQTKLSNEAIQQLIDTVFFDYGETMYTKQLLAQVKEAANKSDTFTQFFTYVMHDLFKQYGLLMIDAASDEMRALQGEYFVRLIDRAANVASVVTKTEQAFSEAGYGTPIYATETNANLFYVQDGERFLLTLTDGVFVNAQANVRFTADELKEIARQMPQQLSNNVVTRPMMQEMVFPVLAFVGGPGELAYWATLGKGFEEMGLQMPIFVPRFMFTIVDAHLEKCAADVDMTIAQVISDNVTAAREAFTSSLQTEDALAPVVDMAQQLRAQYVQLQSMLKQQHIDVSNVIKKNMANHASQFDYLMTKIEEQVLQQHHVTLSRYDELASRIRPNGSYQERVYAPHYMMNLYGEDFVDRLLTLSYDVDDTHKVVTL